LNIEFLLINVSSIYNNLVQSGLSLTHCRLRWSALSAGDFLTISPLSRWLSGREWTQMSIF